jgi:hypothetical protein
MKRIENLGDYLNVIIISIQHTSGKDAETKN